MEPFLVLGLAAVLTSFIAVSWRIESRRTQAFKKLAEDRGYRFEESGSAAVDSFRTFSLFQRGRSERFYNVLYITKESSTFIVADFHYVAGFGKSRTTWKHTVCVARHPELALPRFLLRPQRSVVDTLGKIFGGQDINFEEDPGFSAAFVLQSSGSEQDLRRLFTPGVRASFMPLATQKVRFEGLNDSLLLELPKRCPIEELEELVTNAVNLQRILTYEHSERSGRP